MESIVADCETGLTAAGFAAGLERLWVPDFGWADDEAAAAADPFLPQYLAALQVFAWFFQAKKVWAHLAAEMQAGKTGVILALIRLMLSPANYRTIGIRPDDIYVLTGMSDNAWKKQTRERLPRAVRENVHHNGGLAQVRRSLFAKAARPGGLKNVLVVLDESHIASNYNNKPAREVFDTLCGLCPIEEWAERGIRLVTISATDPAMVIAAGAIRNYAHIVNLRTTDAYQSVESLNTAGRLHKTFDLVDETTVRRLLTFIEGKFGAGARRYHVLRPRPSKLAAVREALERLVPGCNIVQWDSGRKSAGAGADATTVSSEADDINEVLSCEPEAPTFVLLKNMFYASKTLDDSFVGVMHDRVGHKDDTNLQSLLGRACGYGKSADTHIFTSLVTVENYLKVWRDLSPRDRPRLTTAEERVLDRRMAGVTTSDGGLALLRTRAVPVAAGAGAAVPVAEPARRRTSVDEDCFQSEWSQWFTTEEAAMAWWRAHGGRAQKLKSADGFLICSTTGSPCKHKMEEIERFRSGKKTANMPGASKMEVGKTECRRYVAYENIDDPSTARFCVHWIKRVA
jgi:hypothetical protein